MPLSIKEVVQATNHSLVAKTNISSNNTDYTQVLSSMPKQQIVEITNIRTPERFQKYIESKNSPIEFYGKVIDQDSNALSGAKVGIGIRQWYVPIPAVLDERGRFVHLDQTSDANGRFEFHGVTGDGFGVVITKDGYELEPNRYGFGPTAGSYENPVIFKMWSTNIHEQLITGGKSFQIVPDGRPYFISLTDDTISESGTGDLKVWIQYTNQPVRGQLYDWSSEITVINGGLLEMPLGLAMYEAPTGGYVPSFQFQGQIKGGQRGDIGERHFYVMLKNGHEYGQIAIELHAPFNNQIPGLVNLSYVINPSGSRILR